MKEKYIFISFSIGDTSMSNYFFEFAKTMCSFYNIVIFSDTHKPDSLVIPEGIELKYWPSKRPTKFRDAYFLFQNIIKHRPVMTISSFSSVNIFILVGWLLRTKIRIAWIHTLSTQFSQKKINVIRKSFIYKLATQVITNSEATKRDGIKVFSIKESKISVLSYSVKNYNYLLSDTLVDKSKMVYVGRLHPSKGVDVLIKAVAILLKQGFDIHLDIIGSGPQKEELLGLVRSLELNNKVSFLGTKSKLEVLNAFKSSYCAVIPSNSEAFGFTVIEAMSVGTCVIGADNTGIKEIIIPNETGLLFETGNFINLADKLELILLDFTYRIN